jgi:hypothetical protein
VQPALLSMAISAISQKITLEEFQAKSGIAGKTTPRCVLEYLVCLNSDNANRGSLYVYLKYSGDIALNIVVIF